MRYEISRVCCQPPVKKNSQVFKDWSDWILSLFPKLNSVTTRVPLRYKYFQGYLNPS